MTPQFTIIRRVLVGLMNSERKKLGTEIREEVYHMPGSDPQTVCEDFISCLADDDPRLDDYEMDDPDREFEHMIAMDDVKGEFLVFKGIHTARPAGEPLFEEGDLDTPIHWEIKRDAA